MNNLFLHSENHNSTIFQDVQYNDIQYSNNELTPPNWFTELHANAPQTAQDVGYGSLDTYCELSVPPLRGAESEPQFTQDLRQLQQFIQKKVSVLDARKGATGFVFYPNVARKRIQKIFTFASPIAHKAFTDDEKDEYFRHARNERYLLQKIAKAICIDHKRLTYCQAVAYDSEKGIGVFWNNKDNRAFYTGHQTCGFVGCPICQSKRANEDEIEIKQAMAVIKERGYDYLMFTPTTRHKLHNTLDEIFDYRSKVFEFFRNCKPYRKLKKLGYIGDIIAVETPFNDDNGWHVHNHNVMIFDKPIQDQVEFIEKKLISAWLSSCEKAIKKYNLNPHDLMPEQDFINVTFNKKEIDDNIGDYLVKQGADQRIVEFRDGSQIKIKSKSFTENPKWGASKELTRGNSKRSKGNSVTPFDMLRIMAQDPDSYDDKYVYRYREWVQAIKGKSLLRWSPNLRKKLFGDDYKEQKEKVKSDEFAEHNEKIMDLSLEQDKAIQYHNSESDYLSIIERNHIIGDIDPKAILDNLVGLYRAETEKKPIFKMDWIDTWVNGQLVQVPKLYETFAPCELKSS